MAAPRSNGSSSPGTIQYAYMFESNNSPTRQFDALLRSISRYILTEIGDKNACNLTPAKLAAFYRAVGGDYDSLFLSTSHSTISYMWTFTGCQHSLQPTENDYAPPTVPALTPRGFSRWESLEILLGPEEHVPFIQFAVKNWALRHPESGELFPPDLPANMFPVHPDPQVDRWHKSCARKMHETISKDSANKAKGEANPEPFPDRNNTKFAYGVPPGSQFHSAQSRTKGAEADPSERFGYERGEDRQGANGSYRPPKVSPERTRRDRPSINTAGGRRRSFSDYASPRSPGQDTIHHSYSGSYLNPDGGRPTTGKGHARRHSHPRNVSSDSTGDESEGEPVNVRARRRRPAGSPPPPPGVRRVVPPPAPSVTESPPSFRSHRSDSRPEESRRKASPMSGIRSKLQETVSNILPNSRNSSRQSSLVNEPIRQRRSREQIPPSRLSQNPSDLASEEATEESDGGHRRHRRVREERDRERDRYRDKPRLSELDRDRILDDRDPISRRERPYQRRPGVQRRTSSHADADRRREQAWDMRERDRLREDRKKWDRKSADEDMSSHPMTGRRYPETAYG